MDYLYNTVHNSLVSNREEIKYCNFRLAPLNCRHFDGFLIKHISYLIKELALIDLLLRNIVKCIQSSNVMIFSVHNEYLLWLVSIIELIPIL